MEIKDVFEVYKVKDTIHIDCINDYEPVDKTFIWKGQGNEICYFQEWNNDVKVVVGKHWNESLEIIKIIEGTLEITSGNKSIVLSAGEIAIIGGNSIHGTRAITRKLKHQCLQIKHNFLIEHFEYDELMTKILKINDVSKILYYYENIIDNISQSDSIAKAKVKANILLLITSIMEDGSYGDSQGGITQLNEVIIDAIHYININFKENLTLISIAEYFGYSPQNFSIFFKKNIGKTVYSYLNDIRLEHAVYMLLDSNKNIVDIALECGFPNEMAFIKKFKSKYNTTPNIYRKQIQSDKSNERLK